MTEFTAGNMCNQANKKQKKSTLLQSNIVIIVCTVESKTGLKHFFWDLIQTSIQLPKSGAVTIVCASQGQL